MTKLSTVVNLSLSLWVFFIGEYRDLIMLYAPAASLVAFAIIRAQLITGYGIELFLGSAAAEIEALVWEIF